MKTSQPLFPVAIQKALAVASRHAAPLDISHTCGRTVSSHQQLNGNSLFACRRGDITRLLFLPPAVFGHTHTRHVCAHQADFHWTLWIWHKSVMTAAPPDRPHLGLGCLIFFSHRFSLQGHIYTGWPHLSTVLFGTVVFTTTRRMGGVNAGNAGSLYPFFFLQLLIWDLLPTCLPLDVQD